MFSNFSQAVTAIITKDLNYDNEKKEIIAYAIEMLLLGIVGFSAILIVSFIFNALVPAAVAAIFGGILRRFSGGAHFDTPLKCLSFGAVIYSLIGVLAMAIWKLGFANLLNIVLVLISLIIVVFLAPVDSQAKPIHSRRLRNNLKLSSIFIVVCVFFLIFFNTNFLINISAALGIFYQSLTLLPIFNERR